MKLKILVVIFFAFDVIYCQIISCEFKNTIDISGGDKDSKGNYNHKGIIYPPGDFALFKYQIVNVSTKVLADPHMRGCVCKHKPCIRICCPRDGRECQRPEELAFAHDSGEITINLEKTRNYGVLVGRPCKHLFKLDTELYDEDDEWSLLTNGSVETRTKVYGTDSYCFQQANASKKAEAYLCYESEDKDARFIYYPIGMILSIPFLIFTLIVYLSIPELRNLHGKCLMCYVCGLIVFYISLAMVQFKSHKMSPKSCSFIGYLVYCSLLFCFTWLNIMCYDIYFVSKHGVSRMFKSFEHNGFIAYAFYGFTSPLLITFLIYIIDTYELLAAAYLPRFGENRCWLQDSRIVEAIYVYIPMSILIVINITLFVLTAYTIWRAQEIARADDAAKETVLRSRFYIYLRLFIIMGMTWCMESLSWIFKNNSTFFVVADIFNCLQGVFIFLICVLNLSTRQLIARRCCPIDDDESSSDEANMHLKDRPPNKSETVET